MDRMWLEGESISHSFDRYEDRLFFQSDSGHAGTARPASTGRQFAPKPLAGEKRNADIPAPLMFFTNLSHSWISLTMSVIENPNDMVGPRSNPSSGGAHALLSVKTRVRWPPHPL